MNIAVKHQHFRGIIPKVSPKLIGNDNSQIANNLTLENGKIVPLRNHTLEAALPDALRKNIYRYYFDYKTLTCGSSGSLVTMQSATDGSFSITLGGTEYQISGLNFAGMTMDQMATAMQVAIRAASGHYEVVSYNATLGKFIFSTPQASIGYLSLGYGSISRTSGTAIGDMTAYGGLAAAFDGVTSQATGAGAAITGATVGYIGKDWGAGNARTISSVLIYSSNNSGFHGALDTVTLTLQGSTDNFSSSIVTLGSLPVFTNTYTALTKTITATVLTTAYRYHRVKIERGGGAGEIYCAELQFTGTGIHDLSSSTYLNGRTGGTATIGETESSEWLSWTETDIDVAKSPVAADVYHRIYWTGETGGKLRNRGVFGTRDVYIAEPSGPGTVSVSTLWDPSSTTATWSATGCASQGLTLQEYISTPTGFYWKFKFNRQVDSGVATLPTPAITVTFPSPIGAKTVANIGAKVAMIDSGTTWANFELTELSGDGSYTYTGTGPYNITWESFYVEVNVNMNYIFPSTDVFYYLMTFVDDINVEGPPSDISQMVNRLPNQKVALSSIPVSSDPNVTKKRIYRSSTGSSETAGFYFLVELDNATTSYTDWRRATELSEGFSQRENPPDNLLGLVAMPNGFFAAFKDMEVWFSEQYLPASWPSQYMMTVGSPIVGLAVLGNDLYVLTEEAPYVISGNSPGLMSQAKLHLFQSCVSKRSIARVENMVCYASPDGLVGLSGGTGRVLTDNYYAKDTWAALNPENIIGAVFDLKYIAFLASGSGSVVFDFDSDGKHDLTTCDTTCAGAYYDAANDLLYMIISNEIRIWDSPSGTNMVATWRSKEFQYPRPLAFNSARMITDAFSANTQMRLYAENASVFTRAIASGISFRITRLRPERVWSYQIWNDSEIDEFAVATAMEGLLK